MKLLRVLESGCFERLGSTKTRKVKVRVISATNADLPQMLKAGTFREDLYYRLNVVPLCVPSLRERAADIVPLAKRFLSAARLSMAAETALKRYDWPGNVRELRNVITRASLMCRAGVIEVADLMLPESTRGNAQDLSSRATETTVGMPEPDRAAIEAALAASSNVIADAAIALGMTRQSLYRRMQRFGIARAER